MNVTVIEATSEGMDAEEMLVEPKKFIDAKTGKLRGTVEEMAKLALTE